MLNQLMLAMCEFDRGVPHRIQHFTKVHAYCRLIGQEEGLSPRQMEILEAAAYTHDIGIKPALEKFGSAAGPLQEQEGPACARKMLEELGFDGDLIERVCWLIAHHHTYQPVEGIDHRILIEADFLVNLFEGDASREAIETAYRQMFETGTGKRLMREMFDL